MPRLLARLESEKILKGVLSPFVFLRATADNFVFFIKTKVRIKFFSKMYSGAIGWRRLTQLLKIQTLAEIKVRTKKHTEVLIESLSRVSTLGRSIKRIVNISILQPIKVAVITRTKRRIEANIVIKTSMGRKPIDYVAYKLSMFDSLILNTLDPQYLSDMEKYLVESKGMVRGKRYIEQTITQASRVSVGFRGFIRTLGTTILKSNVVVNPILTAKKRILFFADNASRLGAFIATKKRISPVFSETSRINFLSAVKKKINILKIGNFSKINIGLRSIKNLITSLVEKSTASLNFTVTKRLFLIDIKNKASLKSLSSTRRRIGTESDMRGKVLSPLTIYRIAVLSVLDSSNLSLLDNDTLRTLEVEKI